MNNELIGLLSGTDAREAYLVKVGKLNEYACIRYEKHMKSIKTKKDVVTGFLDLSVDSNVVTYLDVSKDPTVVHTFNIDDTKSVIDYITPLIIDTPSSKDSGF